MAEVDLQRLERMAPEGEKTCFLQHQAYKVTVRIRLSISCLTDKTQFFLQQFCRNHRYVAFAPANSSFPTYRRLNWPDDLLCCFRTHCNNYHASTSNGQSGGLRSAVYATSWSAPENSIMIRRTIEHARGCRASHDYLATHSTIIQSMNNLVSEYPYHELSVLRRDMLRFAELQLRDPAAAEDAVQDTMVAAMTRMSTFEGRAKVSTWLFAILKNKIIDILRTRARFVPLEIDDDETREDTFDGIFNDKGYWPKHERPTLWDDPGDALSRQQFWVVFQACLDRLPVNTARVFMMREFLGFDVDEVVAELGISKTNCGVILHRARMALRVCLQTRWFDKTELSC